MAYDRFGSVLCLTLFTTNNLRRENIIFKELINPHRLEILNVISTIFECYFYHFWLQKKNVLTNIFNPG